MIQMRSFVVSNRLRIRTSSKTDVFPTHPKNQYKDTKFKIFGSVLNFLVVIDEFQCLDKPLCDILAISVHSDAHISKFSV